MSESMLSKYALAAVLSFLMVHSAAAQTVRFDTNVGNFDLELNPTGNVNLQDHVNNMLAYVNSGRYDRTVINRVNEVSPGGSPDFVMQMGGFQAHTATLPSSFSSFPSVPSFSPVVTDTNGDGAIDFDTTGLTNSRRTVSLALSSAGPNSGTSSFFVNLNDIPSLDPGGTIGEFVPFAVVSDMTTVDLIENLPSASLPGGGVASSNIPILTNDRLVVVERAFVLNTQPAAPAASSLEAGSTLPLAASAGLQSLTVPETSTLILAVGSLMLTIATSRRRIV